VAVAAGLLAVRNHVRDPQLLDAVTILAGAMMGGIGAYLSISARTESIRLDPVAEKTAIGQLVDRDTIVPGTKLTVAAA
jgi:hypothetical protein